MAAGERRDTGLFPSFPIVYVLVFAISLGMFVVSPRALLIGGFMETKIAKSIV